MTRLYHFLMEIIFHRTLFSVTSLLSSKMPSPLHLVSTGMHHINPPKRVTFPARKITCLSRFYKVSISILNKRVHSSIASFGTTFTKKGQKAPKRKTDNIIFSTIRSFSCHFYIIVHRSEKVAMEELLFLQRHFQISSSSPKEI